MSANGFWESMNSRSRLSSPTTPDGIAFLAIARSNGGRVAAPMLSREALAASRWNYSLKLRLARRLTRIKEEFYASPSYLLLLCRN